MSSGIPICTVLYPLDRPEHEASHDDRLVLRHGNRSHHFNYTEIHGQSAPFLDAASRVRLPEHKLSFDRCIYKVANICSSNDLLNDSVLAHASTVIWKFEKVLNQVR